MSASRLFIDGANLYATARRSASTSTTSACSSSSEAAATWCAPSTTPRWSRIRSTRSIRPLIDWLDYNGFKVVTKPTKEFTDSIGRRKIKGNMDIELAVDALRVAEHLDHMVLFSGDGDFRRWSRRCSAGRAGQVVSRITSQPPMVADDLRRQADHFIDLADCAA